ncbi:mycothiol system anti-sigma-R factor [Corynebacterium yudongzhengii]|uniref:Mycothiol system anti-sigma-R factor n=1 Tax=Corynebacterium yudongzhengii TaxID=2080740 RepID=A0A2U1T534_9CORY|nr:mycothiol system anti-sigma-R factor [Corynebacterium yudongzhengii]AWB81417.1 mycothiol system anti-sigma-R factor [Corynebacterium yudongzhengii]PWC01085.1 mycothiol system anti-sigma-R factor [Corynebacterium yudongzhengii]
MSSEPCPCSCAHVQALICEIIDSDCSETRAAEIRAEISRCEECARRLESERAIRMLMRRCCSEETAPGYLRERITTQINIIRGR